MSLGLIWAESSDGFIGTGGAIPWRLPEDQRRFRGLTTGAVVIMGRVTWESLPERFRPLPDRVNVVVSRSATYSANGAVVVASVGDALAIEPQLPRWSIGGAEIYAATIGLADRLEQTVVRLDVDGDRVAPRISDAWERVAADPAEGWNTAENGLDYRFASFRRRDRDSSAS